MGHSLIKATIIPEVVKIIAAKDGVSESAALARFYKSAVAASLDDDETGLYGQSALFIYSLYEQENSAKPR